MSGFDFIGDVHGCCDSLIALLEKLGYQKRNGAYQHAERQAIFLGDLVDRGPKIRETLHLVRAMVEQGNAQMVLGNHEISCIRYLTPARPGSGREFLREHTERTTFMISETLRQFEQHQAELDEFVQWFYQLPLFIEHEQFRVVHACWDHEHIQRFVERYQKPHIDEEMMHQPLSSMARQAIELLTRGANMSLPGGEAMTTSDGFSRRSFRAKFGMTALRFTAILFFSLTHCPSIFITTL
ncbi:Diadenosine tetraphosphatase [gamma proteobacterium IMCC2047]|nr:Diadenosine tetraphosphatase [gamma proteobacterium IMCC2047]